MDVAEIDGHGFKCLCCDWLLLLKGPRAQGKQINPVGTDVEYRYTCFLIQLLQTFLVHFAEIH